MISSSEVASNKPWQNMGSPPTGFRPKKPFIMPRLVRAKNPDHVIGYGSTFQVFLNVRAKNLCKQLRSSARMIFVAAGSLLDSVLAGGDVVLYGVWRPPHQPHITKAREKPADDSDQRNLFLSMLFTIFQNKSHGCLVSLAI